MSSAQLVVTKIVEMMEPNKAYPMVELVKMGQTCKDLPFLKDTTIARFFGKYAKPIGVTYDSVKRLWFKSIQEKDNKSSEKESSPSMNSDQPSAVAVKATFSGDFMKDKDLKDLLLGRIIHSIVKETIIEEVCEPLIIKAVKEEFSENICPVINSKLAEIKGDLESKFDDKKIKDIVRSILVNMLGD